MGGPAKGLPLAAAAGHDSNIKPDDVIRKREINNNTMQPMGGPRWEQWRHTHTHSPIETGIVKLCVVAKSDEDHRLPTVLYRRF